MNRFAKSCARVRFAVKNNYETNSGVIGFPGIHYEPLIDSTFLFPLEIMRHCSRSFAIKEMLRIDYSKLPRLLLYGSYEGRHRM